MALSRALAGASSAARPGAPLFDSAVEAATLRTRTGLSQAIAEGPIRGHSQISGGFTVFGQHYVAMQRQMQITTGRLRGQLRDMLASRSPDMARLADVDALMEGVLSPRESKLLAAVPALLGTHFQRLEQAAQTHDPGAANEVWLSTFRRDIQGVLLAELDFRFLPIDSLLAALRTHPQESHVQTFA